MIYKVSCTQSAIIRLQYMMRTFPRIVMVNLVNCFSHKFMVQQRYLVYVELHRYWYKL